MACWSPEPFIRLAARPVDRARGIGPIVQIFTFDDPTRPHVLGTRSGALIAGDAATDTWTLIADLRPQAALARDPEIWGFAVDGPDEWVATGGLGVLRRHGGGEFRRIDVSPPHALRACAIPVTGDGLRHQETVGLVLGATHAFVALKACTGVLRVRRDDEAASAILPFGESEAQYLDEREPRAIGVGSRGPLLVGDRGLLEEVP